MRRRARTRAEPPAHRWRSARMQREVRRVCAGDVVQGRARELGAQPAREIVVVRALSARAVVEEIALADGPCGQRVLRETRASGLAGVAEECARLGLPQREVRECRAAVVEEAEHLCFPACRRRGEPRDVVDGHKECMHVPHEWVRRTCVLHASEPAAEFAHVPRQNEHGIERRKRPRADEVARRAEAHEGLCRLLVATRCGDRELGDHDAEHLAREHRESLRTARSSSTHVCM